MRKLGIDYGDVRLGFALSDITGTIASPLEVFARKNPDYDYAYIKTLAEKNGVDGIIVGLPINMDGTTGERARITREFAGGLKKVVNLPVYFVDERLTSAASERMLIAADVRREKRRLIIDKIAAQSILQSFLDNPKKYINQEIHHG